MARRPPGPAWRHRSLALGGSSMLFALGAALAVAGPASAAGAPAPDSASASATADGSTALTLAQWKTSYEHDVGILADDVLVVVDDGKRAQSHDTTAKVQVTLKDCRQWATDATRARSAAPPIPLAAAQRAWASMITASSGAATDCVASLQRGSRTKAKDFQKELAMVEKDEASLVVQLND